MTEIHCKFCDELFSPPPREVNRGNGKFCSLRCSQASRRGVRRAVANTTCDLCTKPFYLRDSRKEKGKTGFHFCSRTCKDSAQRLDSNSGFRSVHYRNGEHTYRAVALRALPHQCGRCGYNQVPGILIVHHKDRNRANNALENLEILCPNCHATEHYEAKDGWWK